MNELSRDARALLDEAAYADAAPQAHRRHARRRFVGALSAGTVVTSAVVAKGAILSAGAGTTTAAAGTSLATVVSGAVAVGFAVGLSAIGLTHAVLAPTPAKVIPSVAPVKVATPTRPLVVPTSEPTPATVPTAAPPVETNRAVTAPSRPNEASIARETELLAEAQRALKSGRPAQALALLDRYAEECKGGALHEEATAARVVVLCGLGRLQDGTRWTEEFLRRYPNSPLVVRVRNACGKPSAPGESSIK